METNKKRQPKLTKNARRAGRKHGRGPDSWKQLGDQHNEQQSSGAGQERQHADQRAKADSRVERGQNSDDGHQQHRGADVHLYGLVGTRANALKVVVQPLDCIDARILDLAVVDLPDSANRKVRCLGDLDKGCRSALRQLGPYELKKGLVHGSHYFPYSGCCQPGFGM